MPSVTKDPGFSVYRIRAGHGDHEYATVAIRDWRSTPSPLTGNNSYHCGEILIHSSFGSWGHQWGNMGSPLRRFLIGIEFGYLFGKLMGDKLDVHDGPGSVDSMIKYLLEERRRDELSHAYARWLYDAIDDARGQAEESAHDFVYAMHRVAHDFRDEHMNLQGYLSPSADRARDMLSEPWERLAKKDDPQAVGFWRDIWPAFIETLKAEAAAEAEPLEHVQC